MAKKKSRLVSRRRAPVGSPPGTLLPDEGASPTSVRLTIIEDAAQAIGARYHAPCGGCPDPGRCAPDGTVGRAAGSLGDAAAWTL